MHVLRKIGMNANKIFKRNCDLYNTGRSCYKYGKYLYMGIGIKKDEKKALEYLDLGCKYNFGKSCHIAACLSKSLDSEKNLSKSLEYLEQGCKNNNDLSCQTLSSIYITGNKIISKNMQLALIYAQKGCVLNNPQSCVNLSIMLKNGDGCDVDLEKSEFYKQKALQIQKNYTDPIASNFTGF
ncbi:unnamed protein product [Gordionus sp. m RMFG-2023]